MNCTWAGQSQSVCLHHMHCRARGRCWWLLGVFIMLKWSRCSRVGSTILWLFSLSTSLQFLSRTASQPAHTLQAAVRWPQGSESHHKGVVYCMYACVCLSLRFYVGKSVSVFVLVEAGPWELRVGASWLQQWLLPWQPRRERCVEWVSGRRIYSQCLFYKFGYLNAKYMPYNML